VLPFCITTLPDDPCGHWHSVRRPCRRSPRFTSTSREATRAEVLVIGAGASDALARCWPAALALLPGDRRRATDPAARRCCARPGYAPGHRHRRSPASPSTSSPRLREFGDNSATTPIDVALTLAFHPGALLLLNRDLLTGATWTPPSLP
jgi:hypothetical protein